MQNLKLKNQINQDLKNAMKAKNELELSVLRMLNSVIMNEAVAKKKKEQGLNDEEIIQVISRQIKQRKDSITQYKKGKRDDLAEQEEKELKILEKYMPEQMSEDQIRKIAQKVIDSGANEFGAVMGQVMAQVKGKADGNVVKKVVEEVLKN
ncbi:aspartyl-tRNA amidotransferase [bacterium]|nr:aspartyl-tRNA amidotransferase [bacterium]|tara:strand:+ start:1283 stop:1735 length:453 start_codon:yes stop_codon:yes gene_type:complete